MNKIAKQLRSGNIHTSRGFDNSNRGIIGDKLDGQDYAMITVYGIHLVDEGNKAFIPISLSYNILERFGFTNNIGEAQISWCGVADEEQKMVIFQNISGSWSVEVDTVSLKSIEYVHELQNMFYYISGEELTIKPAHGN